MAGGAYSALSGLRTRLAQLDRIAADIANAGTAGYKTERVPTVEARRPDFAQVLQTAIDVAPAPGLIDFHEGQIQSTGRELDASIDGRGFFEIETTEGVRYTRNGQFSRRVDGTLVTADGAVVRSDAGTPIVLGPGAIAYETDGSVRAGGVLAG
jgi:flagellar hook-basal body protein